MTAVNLIDEHELNQSIFVTIPETPIFTHGRNFNYASKQEQKNPFRCSVLESSLDSPTWKENITSILEAHYENEGKDFCNGTLMSLHWIQQYKTPSKYDKIKNENKNFEFKKPQPRNNNNNKWIKKKNNSLCIGAGIGWKTKKEAEEEKKQIEDFLEATPQPIGGPIVPAFRITSNVPEFTSLHSPEIIPLNEPLDLVISDQPIQEPSRIPIIPQQPINTLSIEDRIQDDLSMIPDLLNLAHQVFNPTTYEYYKDDSVYSHFTGESKSPFVGDNNINQLRELSVIPEQTPDDDDLIIQTIRDLNREHNELEQKNNLTDEEKARKGFLLIRILLEKYRLQLERVPEIRRFPNSLTPDFKPDPNAIQDEGDIEYIRIRNHRLKRWRIEHATEITLYGPANVHIAFEMWLFFNDYFLPHIPSHHLPVVNKWINKTITKFFTMNYQQLMDYFKSSLYLGIPVIRGKYNNGEPIYESLRNMNVFDKIRNRSINGQRAPLPPPIPRSVLHDLIEDDEFYDVPDMSLPPPWQAEMIKDNNGNRFRYHPQYPAFKTSFRADTPLDNEGDSQKSTPEPTYERYIPESIISFLSAYIDPIINLSTYINTTNSWRYPVEIIEEYRRLYFGKIRLARELTYHMPKQDGTPWNWMEAIEEVRKYSPTIDRELIRFTDFMNRNAAYWYQQPELRLYQQLLKDYLDEINVDPSTGFYYPNIDEFPLPAPITSLRNPIVSHFPKLNDSDFQSFEPDLNWGPENAIPEVDNLNPNAFIFDPPSLVQTLNGIKIITKNMKLPERMIISFKNKIYKNLQLHLEATPNYRFWPSRLLEITNETILIPTGRYPDRIDPVTGKTIKGQLKRKRRSKKDKKRNSAIQWDRFGFTFRGFPLFLNEGVNKVYSEYLYENYGPESCCNFIKFIIGKPIQTWRIRLDLQVNPRPQEHQNEKQIQFHGEPFAIEYEILENNIASRTYLDNFGRRYVSHIHGETRLSPGTWNGTYNQMYEEMRNTIDFWYNQYGEGNFIPTTFTIFACTELRKISEFKTDEEIAKEEKRKLQKIQDRKKQQEQQEKQNEIMRLRLRRERQKKEKEQKAFNQLPAFTKLRQKYGNAAKSMKRQQQKIITINPLKKNNKNKKGRGLLEGGILTTRIIDKKIKELKDNYMVVNPKSTKNCLWTSCAIALNIKKYLNRNDLTPQELKSCKKLLLDSKTQNKAGQKLKSLIGHTFREFGCLMDLENISKKKNINIEVLDQMCYQVQWITPTDNDSINSSDSDSESEEKENNLDFIQVLLHEGHYHAIIIKEEIPNDILTAIQNAYEKPYFIHHKIRKPENKEGPKRKIVVYDIETYKEPIDDISIGNVKQIAYAIGWCFKIENEEEQKYAEENKYKIIKISNENNNNDENDEEKEEEENFGFAFKCKKGKKCLNFAIKEWMSGFVFHKACFYAHNGGKFDLRIILGQSNICFKSHYKIQADEFIELNGRFLTMGVYNQNVSYNGNEEKHCITFKDSLSLFGVGNKLSSLCNEFNTYHKKLEENIAIHDEQYEDTWLGHWYAHDLKKYLMHDCLGLLEVLLAFEKECFESTSIHITEITTGASLAKKYFLKCLYEDEFSNQSIYTLLPHEDTFIRNAFNGGRVEHYVSKEVVKKLYYYDFTSLYPDVARLPLPCGRPQSAFGSTINNGLSDERKKEIINRTWYNRIILRNNDTQRAFWKVKIISPKCAADDQQTDKKPLIGVKDDDTNGLFLFTWFKTQKTIYVYEQEILEAIDQKLDYEFEPLDCYIFNAYPLLKDAMEGLFKKKSDANSKGQDALCKLWKIVMNSLFGVWGIRKYDREGLSIASPEDSTWCIDLAQNRLVDIETYGNYVVTRRLKNLEIPNSNVAVSAAISSEARIKLYRLMCDIESRGSTVYYCDTDSVITDHCIEEDEILGPKWIGLNNGEDLGSLKNEIDAMYKKINKKLIKQGKPTLIPKKYWDKAIIVAAKLYIISAENEQIIKKAHKGYKENPDNNDVVTYTRMKNLVNTGIDPKKRIMEQDTTQWIGGNADVLKGNIGVTLEPRHKVICQGKIVNGKVTSNKGILHEDTGIVTPFLNPPGVDRTNLQNDL